MVPTRQNGVILDFWGAFDIEGQCKLLPNTMDFYQGVLHLWLKFDDPSLKGWWVMAQTISDLTHTHIYIHRHTNTQTDAGNDKTQRPKLSSGNKRRACCEKFRNNTHTLCHELFFNMLKWKIEINATLLEVMREPQFCVLWGLTSCMGTHVKSLPQPWRTQRQKFSLWRYYLDLRIYDHAYSRNLEGKVFREKLCRFRCKHRWFYQNKTTLLMCNLCVDLASWRGISNSRRASSFKKYIPKNLSDISISSCHESYPIRRNAYKTPELYETFAINAFWKMCTMKVNSLFDCNEITTQIDVGWWWWWVAREM